MSKAHRILIKPVITERSTMDREERNKYSFYVRVDSTKKDIKKAVEELFNVKVLSVNTMNKIGKMKRVRYKLGRRSGRKKAVVTLQEGNKIDFFKGL